MKQCPRLSRSIGAIFLIAAAPVFANPNGPATVAGSATFSTSGNTLTVTNSNGTIINWQGFSIGAGEVTRFVQPTAASAVLNRVVGGTPSSILGLLASNGNVFLVNPSGVLFGAGSQVTVGGFTVSTTDISDTNFLAGNYSFNGTGGAGIDLQGTIAATGEVTVAGSGNVQVSGTINSGGTISIGGNGSQQPSGGLTVRSTVLNAGISPGGPIAIMPGATTLADSVVVQSGSPAYAGSLVTIAATSISLNLRKRDLSF